MTIELTASELEIIVEALARFENDDDDEADTLYRRLISEHFFVCDGCGGGPTSTCDADGNHLCRECALASIVHDARARIEARRLNKILDDAYNNSGNAFA